MVSLFLSIGNFHIVYGKDLLTIIERKNFGFDNIFISLDDIIKNIYNNSTEIRLRDNYIITKLSEKGGFKLGYKHIAEQFAKKLLLEIKRVSDLDKNYKPSLNDIGIGNTLNLDPKTYGVDVLRVEDGFIIVRCKGEKVVINY
ncbi:MAG: hypothetical protein CR982_01745 [Candidatus Cloacimonadota bacterium]|nr:MAG: hypothetical protein CR982_01745 [Candidatus Cloacimonadota bacterium]PIE78148.1 MAG: hypothetical protein CSA15_09285 [Candidatus Delongbacteria bacterium]